MGSGSIQVFRLTAVQRVHALARLMRRTRHPNVEMILDVEDGIWMPGDPASTRLRRERARSDLMAAMNSRAWDALNFGVRVNSPGSLDFDADVQWLAALSTRRAIGSIILTKVEEPAALHQSVDALQRADVRYMRLMILLETRLALSRTDAILQAAVARKVTHVGYGHFDLSLEEGVWPFLEYDDVECWARISALRDKTECCGLSFVYPPSERLSDRVFLGQYASRIASESRGTPAIFAISFAQAELLSEPGRWIHQPPLALRPHSGQPWSLRAEAARQVLAAYERPHASADVSFQVDTRRDRFMPPHTRLAALRFLETPRDG